MNHILLAADKYQSATSYLSNIDADWTRLIEVVGPCTHQPRPEREPYEALVRAVAYQQLHVKAGDAILGRLLALNAGSMPSPQQLLVLDIDALRACGFSMRKIETLHGIAEGTLSGVVPDRQAAEQMSSEGLVQRLINLRGIGRWTVEMLLIYTLSRDDILPVDDLGVREGYKRLKGLDKAPSPQQLKLFGEVWSPYRTIASWYLWRVPR
ncbi:MAG TPA: DNA-3-methyladenine glycosylase [Methylophilaceae bacterium]|nr:DNA-3-methyladenine glycosylase [Methylophilaceae bacterium]